MRGTIALRDLAAGEDALSMPLHLAVNIGFKNASDPVRRNAHQTDSPEGSGSADLWFAPRLRASTQPLSRVID